MNRLTYAIGYAIGFVIGFTRGVPKPRHPMAVDSAFCGECNPDCDECPCLDAHYAKQVNIEGYSIEQLYRDIKELERQS